MFFSVTCNAIFALEGKFFKTMPNEGVVIMLIFSSPKQTYRMLLHLISLFGLVFMPPVEIHQLSPNDFGKQVETHHNSITKSQMDKTSILLEL